MVDQIVLQMIANPTLKVSALKTEQRQRMTKKDRGEESQKSKKSSLAFIWVSTPSLVHIQSLNDDTVLPTYTTITMITVNSNYCYGQFIFHLLRLITINTNTSIHSEQTAKYTQSKPSLAKKIDLTTLTGPAREDFHNLHCTAYCQNKFWQVYY